VGLEAWVLKAALVVLAEQAEQAALVVLAEQAALAVLEA
jgi:hypothetical protein